MRPFDSKLAGRDLMRKKNIRIVRLRLPADQGIVEVGRLNTFMSTLAVDFEPSGHA
jgi:hypothetical protein